MIEVTEREAHVFAVYEVPLSPAAVRAAREAAGQRKLLEDEKMNLIELGECFERTGHGWLILKINRRREPRGTRVQIFPGVRGEMMSSRRLPTGDYELAVMIQAGDVRRALRRAGQLPEVK